MSAEFFSGKPQNRPSGRPKAGRRADFEAFPIEFRHYKFIRFGAMDATKPYKFIRFGAMEVAKLPSNPVAVWLRLCG